MATQPLQTAVEPRDARVTNNDRKKNQTYIPPLVRLCLLSGACAALGSVSAKLGIQEALLDWQSAQPLFLKELSAPKPSSPPPPTEFPADARDKASSTSDNRLATSDFPAPSKESSSGRSSLWRLSCSFWSKVFLAEAQEEKPERGGKTLEGKSERGVGLSFIRVEVCSFCSVLCIRLVLLLLTVWLNSCMLLLYMKALAEDSALSATAVNFAVNFVLSAVLGCLLFDEMSGSEKTTRPGAAKSRDGGHYSLLSNPTVVAEEEPRLSSASASGAVAEGVGYFLSFGLTESAHYTLMLYRFKWVAGVSMMLVGVCLIGYDQKESDPHAISPTSTSSLSSSSSSLEPSTLVKPQTRAIKSSPTRQEDLIAYTEETRPIHKHSSSDADLSTNQGSGESRKKNSYCTSNFPSSSQLLKPHSKRTLIKRNR